LRRAGQSQAPLSCAAQGRPASRVASARTLGSAMRRRAVRLQEVRLRRELNSHDAAKPRTASQAQRGAQRRASAECGWSERPKTLKTRLSESQCTVQYEAFSPRRPKDMDTLCHLAAPCLARGNRASISSWGRRGSHWCARSRSAVAAAQMRATPPSPARSGRHLYHAAPNNRLLGGLGFRAHWHSAA
jgi:hypothetical protein